MHRKIHQIPMLYSVLMLGALVLAACSSATPIPPTAAPTTDLDLLRTEVAATVLAEVPQICALTPSATIPPTATIQPTETPTPTLTVTGTLTTGTPGTSTGDQAKWVSQSIQDGTRFTPGEAFTMTWRLQNVGKTTWTSAYRLRFYSGDPYGASKEIALDRDVAPNETIDITIPMKAPTKEGSYRSDWVMSNATRYNFNEPVFLEIVVGRPSTPTATPTVLTPTSTPQDLLPTATTGPTS